MPQASVTRRRFLVSSLGIAVGAIAPLRMAFANTGSTWDTFTQQMQMLANEYAAGNTTRNQVTARGLRYLEALDITSTSFADAIASAYESGNRFWLWQRMLKQANVNGGILNIHSDSIVQLHDHPGATGMLRIISGETEVWQYDRMSGSDDATAELKLTAHRLLKPGDTAVLTPEQGNIHALKAVSAECRMLDFFIPPYQQHQRTWFEPLENDWQARQKITCRCIPQQEYAGA